VLIEAAGSYRKLVTLKQLGAAVQETTGITTTQPLAQWLGPVLDSVADDCQSRGEPLLSSLCVSMQGSVGQGYADAVERVRGARIDDPDGHAANERLECYRHWHAVGLPRDGCTPLRTAHFTPARRAAPRKATVPKPKAAKAPARKTVVGRPTSPAAKPAERLCPTCFTEMPPSGVCYYCE
jgi:hypothetical protein